VKAVDPLKSGIYTLPLVLSLVVSSIMSGIFTQKLGYYVPSMIFAPSLMSVGEGLMSTFNADTSESRWVAYQFLAGFGLGFGMQTSGLAVQTVLPPKDIPTGIAVNFFVQQLGGAVFTSVGQAILTNLLASRLSNIPGFDSLSVVNQGATNLRDAVPPQYLDQVVSAYNYACQRIFLTSMGLAFASLLCALGMEWKSIKKGGYKPPSDNIETGKAGTTASPPIAERGTPKAMAELSQGTRLVTQPSNNLADRNHRSPPESNQANVPNESSSGASTSSARETDRRSRPPTVSRSSTGSNTVVDAKNANVNNTFPEPPEKSAPGPSW
jgi:MFS family permease